MSLSAMRKELRAGSKEQNVRREERPLERSAAVERNEVIEQLKTR